MDLIKRLEAAEEGSRELDMHIAIAAGFKERGVPISEFLDSNRAVTSGELTAYQVVGHWGFPHYTTSIDAALTLVPEGWHVASLHEGTYGGAWFAAIVPNGWLTSVRAVQCRTSPSAPALALCIAALKATDETD